MTEALKIDIWSDIACPWCYIGKRRLEAGIAAYAAEPGRPPVAVEYHSFQLAPDTPVEFEGSAADFLVRHKRLSEAQVTSMIERVTAIAAEEGLRYDYAALQHTNTVKAHQLLHYAKAHGLQLEAKERILRAHFVEGRHLGRVQDLAELAADIGLDRDHVLRSLGQDEYLDAVRADERQAAAYGIHAVPFFVIDGRYGLAGAQPAEVVARALSTAVAERAPAA